LPKMANVKANRKIRIATMIKKATRSRTQVSSPKIRVSVILYYTPRVRGYEDEPLTGWVMYNVATCSSLVP
jgi:hypothetical protein